MNKCKGCGITLQNTDVNALGYTKKLNNTLCERCFKIKNYNYYDNQTVLDTDSIINHVNKINGLKLFLCDLLSLNDTNVELFKKINNPKIMVITKVDIIPKNINLSALENKIKNYTGSSEVYFISIKNDYGKRNLLNKINECTNCLFLGPTSSGKSSLINHLFSTNLTVSSYKNTTQDLIKMNINGINIYDAPGFNDDAITSGIKNKGMIKPKTLHLKDDFELVINDYVVGFDKTADVTLFFDNSVIIKTRKKRNNYSLNKDISFNDVMISNLGFIYVKDTNQVLYNSENVSIRPSLVGEE